jgi:rubrerythrin
MEWRIGWIPGLLINRQPFELTRRIEMDWLNFLKIMGIEERAAQAKYQLAMEIAPSEELRSFFARLRDEEAFHAQFLDGEYTRLEIKLAQGG